MQITFPYQKKVRILDTETVPMDVLEVIIRHGVSAMAANSVTADIIKTHSKVRKPPAKPTLAVSNG